MIDSLRVWGVIFTGAALCVLLLVMVVAIWQHFEGELMSQHTKNIRHSIGYIDAQNSHCEQDMADYDAAAAAFARDAGNPDAQVADQSHMRALVVDCRNAAGQLAPDEVVSPVAQFLAAHQGENR